MALDAIKSAAYQNSINQSAKMNVNIKTSNNDTVGDSSVSPVSGIKPVENQEADKKEAPVSEQHIKTEISKANGRLKPHMTRCEFAYHEDTKRVTIKVLDRNTAEVIREIPPEATLEMIQKMWELAGLLIDERR